MPFRTLRSPALAALLAASTMLAGACAGGPPRDPRPPRIDPPVEQPGAGLQAFASREELAAYLRELAAKNRAQMRTYAYEGEGSVTADAAQAPAPLAEPSASADESVTNVQHAGVDEGGIVKLHGDYLVILRRGRLFTVRVGDGALRPVSAVDAFGPEVDPDGTWYDELIVSGDVVAVIGYSYQRGGTEIGLFRLGPDGTLAYRSTWQLRSNDYYSSRNYASRLVEGKLVFYAPLYLDLHGADPFQDFPAVRRWHRGAGDDGFRPLVNATRVYRPVRPLDAAQGAALHTVTTCGLAGGELDCEATAVMGPPGRVFYVSPGSVYVWTSDWAGEGGARPASTLYRMPLDGSRPGALAVAGSPVDQFSFLESDDGHLNVLVRSEGMGDPMGEAERGGGAVSLLRVALDRFGDGTRAAPASSYRPLPAPRGYAFQNRFVGNYLLYGTGTGWDAPEADVVGTLRAVPWRGGAVAELPLPHGVDRIEALGGDAVVVGTDGRDLHFTTVRLGGRPALAGDWTMANASQGELRSHGFFYRAEGPAAGILGLPVRGPGRPGYEHLIEGSASIVFLRNRALRLEELGTLGARPEGSADDGCRASCVDWYGNARPLFVRGRVFALLGYELVEGAVDGGRIRETRRVSYAPGRTAAAVED